MGDILGSGVVWFKYMACKTCKYLDVKPDKAGRIVARKDSAYRCLAPEPPLPLLPVSITKAYGFSWPPHRTYVLAEDGEGCPVYEERPKVERFKSNRSQRDGE